MDYQLATIGCNLFPNGQATQAKWKTINATNKIVVIYFPDGLLTGPVTTDTVFSIHPDKAKTAKRYKVTAETLQGCKHCGNGSYFMQGQEVT